MAEESQLFHGRVGGGNKWIYLKRNTEQETKIYDAQLSSHNKKYEESLKEQEAAIKASNKRIQKFKAEKNDKAVLLELKKLEQLNADKEKLVKDFENVKKTIREKSVRTAEIFEQNRYKSMTNREKKQYLKEVAERKQVELKSLKDKYAALEAEKQRLKNILRSDASDTEKEEASKSLKVVEKQLDKKSSLSKEIDDQSRFTKDAENIAKLFYDAFATRAEKAKDAAERYEKSEKRLAELRAEEINAKKEYDKLKKDARKNENKVDKDKLKTAKQNLKDAKKAVKDQEQINDEALSEKAKAASEAEKDETEEEKNKKAAAKFASVVTAINDRISGFMTDIYGQQSRMKGRLQGSGVNWTGAVLDTTTTIGMTGVVKQKNVVEKMIQLVDSGVAYNIEMRAFLAEMSTSIASTFNAFDSNLLRIIRLQQADTTAARLGMEASLTKLFNEYFKDTSYLTDSGPADAITGAILDASATMDKNASLEFEFTVQKWLGSLYSLGMSSEAVSKVAEGLNYLGTGNVNALSNNPALQTLFAMSASRVDGKSYAEMLTRGITAEDTNKLLRSMVEYLAEIAESQTNYVTKAAYADLFNMSLTDLSAFASLTETDLENIYNRVENYDTLKQETQTQLNSVMSRMSIAELIDNVIENAEVGSAAMIGSNPVTYGMWKAMSLLKTYVGEVKIPGVTGMGTGIASGLDLLNLAQTAMAGMGMLGSLVLGIPSMLSGGALNLDNWNFDEYTERGKGLSILNTGSLETSSYSAKIGVGGASGDTVSDVSMESGKESGMEAAGITSEEMEEDKEIPKKISEALNGESTPTVISLLQEMNEQMETLSLLQNIDNLLREIDESVDTKRVFYTAIAGVLPNGVANQVTNLSTQLSAVSSSVTSSSSSNENNNVSSLNMLNTLGNKLLNGSSSSTEESDNFSLESIISSAVEEGIRRYAAISKLPVEVSTYGGGL